MATRAEVELEDGSAKLSGQSNGDGTILRGEYEDDTKDWELALTPEEFDALTDIVGAL
jgi:hypothetical protein